MKIPANSCLQVLIFFRILTRSVTKFVFAGECRRFAIHPMANFQLGSPANSRCGGASFENARVLFFAVLPGAFVKELAFRKAVFFLNARFADGVFDRDFALDGLRVNEHLAAHGFGVFGEHFEAEMVHAGAAKAGEEL